MIAALEEPKVREWVCPISVEDYHRLHSGNKRTEQIQGVVLQKKPKSPLHANSLVFLLRYFYAVLGKHLFIQSENPLTLADSELAARANRDDPLFAKRH
jgi:Uma2 family endonuclease